MTATKITVSDGTLIGLDNAKVISVTLTSCEFQDITRAKENGAAIIHVETNVKCDVILSGCKFDKITATESTKGDAVGFVSADAVSTFTVNGVTSFQVCKCKIDTGFGGAIYLEMSALDQGNLNFGSVTFGKNEAMAGTNLYLSYKTDLTEKQFGTFGFLHSNLIVP